jgi:hypothetical protein
MSARVRGPTLCEKQPMSFDLISQNQYYFSTMEQYFSLTTNQQQSKITQPNRASNLQRGSPQVHVLNHNLRYSSTSINIYGHVRLSYNPYFLACFFSRNNIFLSQQISEHYFQP